MDVVTKVMDGCLTIILTIISIRGGVNMSDIKLILSDIDGCLCGEIYDLAAIGLIRKYCESVWDDSSLPPLAFATGRGGAYVHCLVQILNAFTPDNTQSIIENGSYLFKPKGRIYLPHPGLKGKEGLIAEARAEIAVLIEDNGPARSIQGKEASLSLKPADENIATAWLERKVRMMLDPELLEQLFITHSTTAVDITVRGVDKGSCLRFLCEETNVLPEEILAIGDTAGDLPILQAVGFPACPRNASEEVKKLVREKGGYVAQAEFAWGVVEIMKHFELL